MLKNKISSVTLEIKYSSLSSYVVIQNNHEKKVGGYVLFRTYAVLHYPAFQNSYLSGIWSVLMQKVLIHS